MLKSESVSVVVVRYFCAGMYVDSLVCGLRNYAKKLVFKESLCHFDGISAFDSFMLEISLINFRDFGYYVFLSDQ